MSKPFVVRIFTPDERRTMAALYDDGRGLKFIARQLHTDQDKVRRALMDMGIRIRSETEQLAINNQRMRRRFSEADRAQMRALYSDCTIRQVARALHTEKRNISRELKAMGVPMRRTGWQLRNQHARMYR